MILWIKPLIYSWGKDGDDPERSEFLQDFQWQGTRDMSAFLTIPEVINFFKINIESFQERSKKLILNSREQFQRVLGTHPISKGDDFLGQMISFPLPKSIDGNLKDLLWENHNIEIPIFEWNKKKFIRLSIHIYNDQKDIDSLMNALRSII